MNYSQHPLDNKLLLGRYRVMRLLGEGGMGTVHLARVEGAEGFTRPVVVKRMKRDIRETEAGNRLFIREAKILSKLQHPGIVGISDFGVEDGAHIMVLEYVHGYTLEPLQQYRQRRDLLMPLNICLFVMRKVLAALNYAHHFDTEEGREIEIVHRDISPDNILLSNNGYVQLLDFGIASMRGPSGEGATKSAGFRGKLCYAAPETVQGEPATPRSDQYSVGIVLLELLTGETPFSSDSIAETFSRMVNELPPMASEFRIDVPEGLDQVLARALSKTPSQRFDSAQAFSKELRKFQTEDDEDIAESLSKLVREDFAQLPAELGIEGLGARETALQRILSNAPGARPAPMPAESAATMVGQTPSMAPPQTMASVDRLSPAPAVQLNTGQKQLHGLLWGLLVVGGIIALGLGAAVALLSKGGTAGEQVVIVGGDQGGHSDNDEPAPAAAQPLAAAPAPSHVTVVDSPPTPTETQIGSVRRNTEKTPKKSQSKALSQAVQARSGAFQGCFAKHLQVTQKQPKAVLHFSVAKQGGTPQVKVEPLALATTPLGGCLKAAGARVNFPPLAQSVAFRVPVRARVSRSKAQ